jgi:MoaA/NifB/PqqE/SkfB family radical SAM enzyme
MSFRCSRSLGYLEIYDRGEAWLCCPHSTTSPLGRVLQDDVMGLWNGPRARKVREEIARGTFSLCNRCSYLPTPPAPCGPIEEVEDDEVPDAPSRIHKLFIAFDRSCTMRCDSCRSHVFEYTGGRDDEVRALYEWLLGSNVLEHVDCLRMLSSGDPMTSALCQDALRRIPWWRYPDLKLHFQTNGIFFTPERYLAMTPETRSRLESVSISIDAATRQTYAKNRSRGREETYDVLLENLRFVSELKQAGKLQLSCHVMVVQANNFREMEEFAEQAHAMRADAEYMQLNNWGTFTDEEFARRAVHLPEHPDHAEYLRVRELPIFSGPGIIKIW